MTQPLKPDDIHLIPASLQAWGEAEYQLRTMMTRAHRADLWPTYQALCVRDLTCALYQRRGMSVTPESLSPAYDLLRHGRPVDFDLLHEARYTRSVLSRHYGRDAPMTADTLDAWLRAIIELANTIGSYEPDAGGSLRGTHTKPWSGGGSGPLFDHGHVPRPVFEIPPGPLERFRSAIRGEISTSPPLLAVLGLLNTLEAFDTLFPRSIDLAAMLLLPGLVSYGFAISPLALFDVPGSKDWVHISDIGISAKTLSARFDDIAHSVEAALLRAGHKRTGSRLPAAISAIIVDPVFTSQELAKTIGSVPRTTEKLVSRLQISGLIHPLQQSGRLTIWSKR